MAGLILFTTTQCSYCKPIKQMIENLKTEYEDEPYEFCTMVIDASDIARDYAMSWGVTAVPTIIFFQNAEEVHRIVGPVTEGVILENMRQHMEKDTRPEYPDNEQ